MGEFRAAAVDESAVLPGWHDAVRELVSARGVLGFTSTVQSNKQFGMVVADCQIEYANQGKARKGTVLYRVVWQNYPPDMVWYEPADNLGEGWLEEYEAGLEAEAQLDAEEAAELEGEDQMEEQDGGSS